MPKITDINAGRNFQPGYSFTVEFDSEETKLLSLLPSIGADVDWPLWASAMVLTEAKRRLVGTANRVVNRHVTGGYQPSPADLARDKVDTLERQLRRAKARLMQIENRS